LAFFATVDFLTAVDFFATFAFFATVVFFDAVVFLPAAFFFAAFAIDNLRLSSDSLSDDRDVRHPRLSQPHDLAHVNED
jgi:hypothetical protein